MKIAINLNNVTQIVLHKSEKAEQGCPGTQAFIEIFTNSFEKPINNIKFDNDVDAEIFYQDILSKANFLTYEK